MTAPTAPTKDWRGTDIEVGSYVIVATKTGVKAYEGQVTAVNGEKVSFSIIRTSTRDSSPLKLTRNAENVTVLSGPLPPSQVPTAARWKALFEAKQTAGDFNKQTHSLYPDPGPGPKYDDYGPQGWTSPEYKADRDLHREAWIAYHKEACGNCHAPLEFIKSMTCAEYQADPIKGRW